MANRIKCGADEALASVHTIRKKVAEAQDVINRLKNEIYKVPLWCEIDSVIMLIEKCKESSNSFDEIIHDAQKMVHHLNKCIDEYYVGDSWEAFEQMNAQKIEF